MGAGISILGTFSKTLQVILIISGVEKHSSSRRVFSSKVFSFGSRVFVSAHFSSQGISWKASWEEAHGS